MKFLTETGEIGRALEALGFLSLADWIYGHPWIAVGAGAVALLGIIKAAMARS